MRNLSRRTFLRSGAGAGAALVLAACEATGGDSGPLLTPAPLAGEPAIVPPGVDPSYALMYAEVKGEKFPVPPVDLSKIDPAFLRAEVAYPTPEPPGTIVVDPTAHYLYLVGTGGMATRYGVGVGREGFGWTGDAYIKFKREWPDWYPVEEMLQRQPEIRKILVDLPSGKGLPGGPRNPIGARGMYLWQGDKDTLYRIHGTTEPHTIGHSVSSGCIRMVNQDVINLYGRVEVDTQVKVLPSKVA